MDKKAFTVIISVLVIVATATMAFAGTSTISKYTGKGYSHDKRFEDAVIVNAIDVSQYQGNIDWTKVKADGIDFAIIRVGGRGYSESGRLYFDDYYKKNIEGAKKAGIAIGIYYFSQAKTEKEAQEEVRHCLELLGKYDIKLPIFMDYEKAGNPGRIANLSKAQRTKNAKAFCEGIESAGYNAGVYSNLLFLENSIDGKNLSSLYTIWAAQYNDTCDFQSKYQIWQYSSDGKVSGINSRVDCNFWYIQKKPTASQEKSLANCDVKVEDMLYTGTKNYQPEVKVTYNGKTLTEGKDYKVAYVNNRNMGTAYAYVTGWGEYADYNLQPFKIAESSGTDESAGVESDVYKTGEYITGVVPGTDIKTFKGNIKIHTEGYTYKITDSAGKEVKDGIIGTGYRMTLYNSSGKKTGESIIVCRGDCDGDGKCGLSDLVKLRKHIMELDRYYGAAQMGLDVNEDEKVSLADLILVRKHIMGLSIIK